MHLSFGTILLKRFEGHKEDRFPCGLLLLSLPPGMEKGWLSVAPATCVFLGHVHGSVGRCVCSSVDKEIGHQGK